MNYWLVETKDGDTGINSGLMPRQISLRQCQEVIRSGV